MKKKLCKLLVGVLTAGQLFSSFGTIEAIAAEQKESLKQLYRNEFDIGVAVPDYALSESDCTSVIKEHFSVMTMENETKPAYLMDERTSKSDLTKYKERIALNFNALKNGFNFAKNNNIKIRGHVMVWHSQTPEWIFYEDYDTNGTLAGRDLMLKRMEHYIEDLICYTETNYPGVVYAWDVVNEAVKDEFWGVAGMRSEDSLWYQTIGEDYVQKAFEYARKYTKQYAPDHKIKLFYNDYNEIFDAKRAGMIAMLKPVKEAGNLDGVGLQSHLNADLDVDRFLKAIQDFNDELGVEIQITELDAGCVNKDTGEEYATLEQQGVFFKAIMEGILQKKRAGVPITAVTFWGLKDDMSWRKEEGGCLLFDDEFNKKPAYEGVASIMRGDKTSLVSKIEEAETILGLLHDNDKAALQEQIDLANELINNPNVLQEEIDTFVDGLTTEIVKSEEMIETYNKEPITPSNDSTVDAKEKEAKALAKYIGKTFEKNKLKYKITACDLSQKTVAVSGVKSKTKLKTAKIPDTIVYDGITFHVTEIGAGAFKNQTNLTKVTVGKNVEIIGQKAFYGDKKLSTVLLKTDKLTKVGKNAFGKVSSSIRIAAPKAKFRAYSKLIKKSKLKKFKLK